MNCRDRFSKNSQIPKFNKIRLVTADFFHAYRQANGETDIMKLNFIFCSPCISLWFLVNDQLDAQFFSIYLFQFFTCFEQTRAHHQENQLYQYNIWYMSLCVGDRFVCRSESSFPTCTRNGNRHRVTHTRCCIDTIDSPDDEHGFARSM